MPYIPHRHEINIFILLSLLLETDLRVLGSCTAHRLSSTFTGDHVHAFNFSSTVAITLAVFTATITDCVLWLNDNNQCYKFSINSSNIAHHHHHHCKEHYYEGKNMNVL